MIVNAITVYVRDEYIDDFIRETIKNCEASIQEPGNIRFDVLQSQENPTRFLLYEVYESKEAVEEHKKTDHYLSWREAVAPWMKMPRQNVPFNAIRPTQWDT